MKNITFIIAAIIFTTNVYASFENQYSNNDDLCFTYDTTYVEHNKYNALGACVDITTDTIVTKNFYPCEENNTEKNVNTKGLVLVNGIYCIKRNDNYYTLDGKLVK